MEQFKMDYSLKNIPVPSNYEYKLQLISKVESLVKRMRWKALAFLGGWQNDESENYGFRTRKYPPVVKELAYFENDLITMMQEIEFKNNKNSFQKKLKDDINRIKK